ncbi:mitochondrial outer membrane translocase complex, subunit Tom5 [Hypoxylon sp. NC1633]|nr:mitochondrial outer membrane translocase complex, subunit Tom5 [Hypoxylon sp. NC1633]
MFGGFAAPQFSKEELEIHEAEATFTVQAFVATAITLYLAPFAVDAVSSIF